MSAVNALRENNFLLGKIDLLSKNNPNKNINLIINIFIKIITIEKLNFALLFWPHSKCALLRLFIKNTEQSRPSVSSTYWAKERINVTVDICVCQYYYPMMTFYAFVPFVSSASDKQLDLTILDNFANFWKAISLKKEKVVN